MREHDLADDSRHGGFAIALSVLLICAFWQLAAPGDAVATDLEVGIQAYQEGDWPAALAEFRPLAKAGETEAQALLAIMHAEGWHVDPDPVAAQMCSRLAAETGDGKARDKRDRHRAQLTDERAAEAARRAHAWSARRAE